VIDPLDESLGWNKLSAAPIEVHALPGDHHTLLTEPYVVALGALLKARLASVSPSAAPPAEPNRTRLTRPPQSIGDTILQGP
jgi:hypothetical protein